MTEREIEASTSAPNPKLLTKLYLYDLGRDPVQYRKKLLEWGIVPAVGTYMCSKCGAPYKLINDQAKIDKVRWYCGRMVAINKKRPKRCLMSVTFRSGTFFANSKLSALQLLMTVYHWAHLLPLTHLSVQVDVSMKTAVGWASFCREVVLDTFILHKKKLGGVGKIVEIEQSKFEKRKYHRGRHVEGQWVFGGYERGTGRVFMVPAKNQSGDTLLPVLQEWIEPGTTVISDYWREYNCISLRGYEQLKVGHFLVFKDPEQVGDSNEIEAFWKAAKLTRSRDGRRKSYVPGNLARYMFLKGCNELKRDPFVEFLRLAGKLYNPLAPAEEMEDLGAVTDDSGED